MKTDRMYRVLLVEDMPSDAFLVKREVKKILGPCTFECVDTKSDYIRSLDEFKPDIILSDYSIPGFDWLTAFKLLRERNHLTPFIIVTGSTNPAIVAECKTAGATDCISKVYMDQLGPAILKVLPAGSL